MFCKNCGNKMDDQQVFCGNCGQPVVENQENTSPKANNFAIMKLIKIYFAKPITFFSELNDEDSTKASIVLVIVLPIIYGLLNILYKSSLINSIINKFKGLPDVLSGIGIITPKEAVQAKQEMIVSSGFLDMKNKIYALFDNKDIFLNGVIQVIGIVVLTGIILAILNAIMLKNKLSNKHICLLATAAYIPLVLSLGVSIIATFISIIFGAFIILFGYILSFITLYSGIIQLSEEKKDNIFILMAILFLVVSAIASIVIVKQFESSITSVSNIYKLIQSW